MGISVRTAETEAATPPYYCLARALHSEDLRTWCSARASQRLVLRRVRGGVLRPP